MATHELGIQPKLKKLLDRITNATEALSDARVENLDRLLKADSDTILGATYDDTTDSLEAIRNKIDTLPTSSAGINTVQRGTATIGSGSGSINVTITAVTLAKSWLVFSYKESSIQSIMVAGKLNSTTNINFDRINIGAFVTTIEWEVVEFN